MLYVAVLPGRAQLTEITVPSSWQIVHALFNLLMHENCHRKFPKCSFSTNNNNNNNNSKTLIHEQIWLDFDTNKDW